MLRIIRTSLALLGLAAMLWFGAIWYAEFRVGTAFADAGMADKAAACMGHRLVKRLSFQQLGSLQALQEEAHPVGGLVRAARKVNDPNVIAVITSSAALCSNGLAR